MKTPTNPWADLDVPSIVNAAGKMTYLGSSRLHEEVQSAMALSAVHFVDMSLLKERASQKIAEMLGVPGCWIVASAAAGLVGATAACIAGDDLAEVEAVPAVSTAKREVILPTAHAVHFGAPISQMIRIGGGLPVLVGHANRFRAAHIEGPTSGIVIGDMDRCRHVAAQDAGVSRAMKVGKETIAGLLVAIERYVEGESLRDNETLAGLITSIQDKLPEQVRAYTAVVLEESRRIPRLRIELPPHQARALIERLEAANPPVKTRNHGVGRGRIEVDPRELKTDEVPILAESIATSVLKVTNA